MEVHVAPRDFLGDERRHKTRAEHIDTDANKR